MGTRVKGNSIDAKNVMHQSWSSQTYEQTYRDDKGLEIFVKLPRTDTEVTTPFFSTPLSTTSSSTTTTTVLPPSLSPPPSTAIPPISSYPLSEDCERYKQGMKRVVSYAQDQVDKLIKGEIPQEGCDARVFSTIV